VNHRHLLPNEIDLLVDGEVGFGVAPLRAHVDDCTECRASLEEARTLVYALEALPHITPSGLFAERVMLKVQVYEPWHVAALESARRFIPQSRPMRVLAAAGGLSAGFFLTVAAVFAAARLDLVVLVGEALVQRAGSAAMAAAGDLVAGAFGEPALAALRGAGAIGLAGGVGALLATVIAAAVGLRALARVAVTRHR
jgi:hypothetical protein